MIRRVFSSIVSPVRIQILSKPNCCLCDQAFFQVSRLVANIQTSDFTKTFTVEKVNIETDPDLNDEFGLTIPVIRVNETVVSESVIDVPKLREFLLAPLTVDN